MTVYVVHPVTDDISSAREFGEFHYINKRYVYGDELETRAHVMSPDCVIPEDVQRRMLDAAMSFDPNRDYLLIAGDHLQLMAMSAILASRRPRGFMVLRFDRKIPGYIPVWIAGGLVPTIQSVL